MAVVRRDLAPMLSFGIKTFPYHSTYEVMLKVYQG